MWRHSCTAGGTSSQCTVPTMSFTPVVDESGPEPGSISTPPYETYPVLWLIESTSAGCCGAT